MKPGSLRFEGRSRNQKLEAFTFFSLYLLSVYSRAYHGRYAGVKGPRLMSEAKRCPRTADETSVLSVNIFILIHSVFPRSATLQSQAVLASPLSPSLFLLSCPHLVCGYTRLLCITEAEHRQNAVIRANPRPVSQLWLVGLCGSPEAKHSSASISSVSL